MENNMFDEKKPVKGDLVVSRGLDNEAWSDELGVRFRYVGTRINAPKHVMRYLGSKVVHYDYEVKLAMCG